MTFVLVFFFELLFGKNIIQFKFTVAVVTESEKKKTFLSAFNARVRRKKERAIPTFSYYKKSRLINHGHGFIGYARNLNTVLRSRDKLNVCENMEQNFIPGPAF